MVENILVFAYTGCFVELPQHQALEGLRLNFHGSRAQIGDQQRGTRENEVTRQDGDGISPNGLGGIDAAAFGRIVHHIVVVEGRQMGELDNHRGLDHVVVNLSAHSGGKQSQKGTHALSTSEQ